MRTLFWLLLACFILPVGCAPIDAANQAVLPVSAQPQAGPRGIVGEVCPPALAAKGYC